MQKALFVLYMHFVHRYHCSLFTTMVKTLQLRIPKLRGKKWMAILLLFFTIPLLHALELTPAKEKERCLQTAFLFRLSLLWSRKFSVVIWQVVLRNSGVVLGRLHGRCVIALYCVYQIGERSLNCPNLACRVWIILPSANMAVFSQRESSTCKYLTRAQ